MKRVQFPRLGEVCCETVLDNGLKIQVVPRPGYLKSYAFFATSYGGMNVRFRKDGVWQETPAGVAHFLEHKMFDTKEGNALQKLTANGASANAFTAAAMTAYYFDCTERFEENLRTLLSFVSQGYFTQESVDKEQGIIGQEIQMIEDDPTWRMYQNLQRALYQNHPLRIPLAGSRESISHITAKTLYQCHNAFYQPSNMALCVIGDVEPERVAQTARLLLPEERQQVAEKDWGEAEPETPAEAECMEEMAVSSTNFMLGFKCPPHPEGEENLRLELLGDLAGDLLIGPQPQVIGGQASLRRHRRVQSIVRQALSPGAHRQGFLRQLRQQPQSGLPGYGRREQGPLDGASGGAGGRGAAEPGGHRPCLLPPQQKGRLRQPGALSQLHGSCRSDAGGLGAGGVPLLSFCRPV